jgi:hydroxymethylpyrimidine pyrophosphatase-like HAD family hydrolase
MGNAADEIKEMADHVTLEVDQSGVAAAVGRFLL